MFARPARGGRSLRRGRGPGRDPGLRWSARDALRARDPRRHQARQRRLEPRDGSGADHRFRRGRVCRRQRSQPGEGAGSRGYRRLHGARTDRSHEPGDRPSLGSLCPRRDALRAGHRAHALRLERSARAHSRPPGARAREPFRPEPARSTDALERDPEASGEEPRGSLPQRPRRARGPRALPAADRGRGGRLRDAAARPRRRASEPHPSPEALWPRRRARGPAFGPGSRGHRPAGVHARLGLLGHRQELPHPRAAAAHGGAPGPLHRRQVRPAAAQRAIQRLCGGAARAGRPAPVPDRRGARGMEDPPARGRRLEPRGAGGVPARDGAGRGGAARTRGARGARDEEPIPPHDGRALRRALSGGPAAGDFP